MSEPNEAIEVTAPSVNEAIKQALDQLGASEDDVVIQVLSTPRSGVLGLGARHARVRVERRAPEGARSGVMSRRPHRRDLLRQLHRRGPALSNAATHQPGIMIETKIEIEITTETEITIETVSSRQRVHQMSARSVASSPGAQ